jgi:hypothetical protein
MSSLTATLAVLLTVNMIIERREFLSMLTEIEASRSTLNRDLETALARIRQLGNQLRDADRVETQDVRRIAAEICLAAERLDPSAADRTRIEVASDGRAPEGALPASGW